MAIEPTNRTRHGILITTGVFFLVEWLLFELIRVPYRPPHDMLTLLGTEIYFVVIVMGMTACSWVCAALSWLIRFRFNSKDYAGYAILLTVLCAAFGLMAFYPPWVVTPFHLIFPNVR